MKKDEEIARLTNILEDRLISDSDEGNLTAASDAYYAACDMLAKHHWLHMSSEGSLLETLQRLIDFYKFHSFKVKQNGSN